MTDNTSGRSWARLGVVVGISFSIAGNVTDTVMKHSDVPVWLRISFATIWPVMLFVAVEVLVRIQWLPTWAHRGARTVLLSVAVPTAVTSFLHLHDLMTLAGETGVARVAGPLSVDGLMIGCAVALLVTRSLPPSALSSVRGVAQQFSGAFDSPPSSVQWTPPEEVPPLLPAETLPRRRPSVEELEEIVNGGAPAATRARASTWPIETVVRMMLDGAEKATVLRETKISETTHGRVRQAVTLLREDPHAEVPSLWKVRADVVQVIRAEVQKLS